LETEDIADGVRKCGRKELAGAQWTVGRERDLGAETGGRRGGRQEVLCTTHCLKLEPNVIPPSGFQSAGIGFCQRA
jgi:hypothetical protein